MSLIDDLISLGYGGYQGWNDPNAAKANFESTGGKGKETQQTPQGYKAPQGYTFDPSHFFTNLRPGFQQGATEAGNWATQQAQSMANSILPIASKITQAFGIKSPYDVFSHNTNTGTDFAVPEGTPVVVPTGRWRVQQAFNQAQGRGYIGNNTNSGYGNSVVLQNMDTGEKLRFSHLSKVNVAPGDVVGGHTVGLSGATGNVTGPHLDTEYYDSRGKLGDVTKARWFNSRVQAMGLPNPIKAKEQQSQTQRPY